MTNIKNRPDFIDDAGLKPKDLCLIPFRFALAMQAAGWWIRNVIIWSKPNPMPESVTDRCTTAHEYIFFMTRSAKYWCDMDAVREESEPVEIKLMKRGINPKYQNGGLKANHLATQSIEDATRNLRSVWQFPTQPYPEAHFATYPEKLPETCILMGCPQDGTVLDPFTGSGTTLAVAKRLRRHYLGFELKPEYVELAQRRIAQQQTPMW